MDYVNCVIEVLKSHIGSVSGSMKIVKNAENDDERCEEIDREDSGYDGVSHDGTDSERDAESGNDVNIDIGYAGECKESKELGSGNDAPTGISGEGESKELKDPGEEVPSDNHEHLNKCVNELYERVCSEQVKNICNKNNSTTIICEAEGEKCSHTESYVTTVQKDGQWMIAAEHVTGDVVDNISAAAGVFRIHFVL